MPKIKKPNGYQLFKKEIEPHFLPREVEEIMDAYTLSRSSHLEQTRLSGAPYFVHPKAVARIGLLECRIYDWKFAILLLLHDGPEDTHLATLRRIARTYGKSIARDVQLLTKPAPDYFGRLRDAGRWRPLAAKLCDRLDNIRTVGEFEETRRRRYIIETREQIIPLLDVLEEVIPPEYAHAVPYLRGQLHAECNKWN